jgi:hypothetical protein
MKKRLFALGLMLALGIAGAAWALQPAGGAAEREHVIAADDPERLATHGTVDGTDAFSVEQVVSGNRRLLGLYGLAVFGAALVIRARRPLTI